MAITENRGSFNEDTISYFKQFYWKPCKEFWVEAGVFIFNNMEWEDEGDRRELLEELEYIVFDS
jgi:hypothetical protein